MSSKVKCTLCSNDVHWYWGDINCDTYRAYDCDENGERTDETTILPRMDRVDRVEDESFYMCSNGSCMMVWQTEKEITELLSL